MAAWSTGEKFNMSYYNTTALEAANTTIQQLTAVNTLSGGLLSGFILMAVFVSAAMMLRERELVESVLAASILT